ncbi:DUF4199 domain-containing protein [Pontibacter flavimaris]|uniref:DUF4199 domain-containing protein n=1 Tax=Pontibacter flavimaris TaxID=1797110 RepID=A0A1Q5PBS8_9BACT|nr:DUF4199 domain-containing protein [Pontibacter flavimaris]OKL39653.1 hypothetical protein A3841_01065 [Pontibacter flavimaris]
MASAKVSFQNIAIKYGLIVGAAHIIFFLLMRMLGLTDIVELSYLSGIFLIIGIVVAISRFKRLRGGVIRYFDGLGVGLITAFVSSLILALFLVFYVTVLDRSYLEMMQSSALFPEGLSVLSMFWITIAHGTWPGFIVGFIAMQWFKSEEHTMPNRA